ncbi:MAG: hypothetical protein JWN18_135 [Parcubacteria group bacterium]|nr:hypothetical protein [Parcubacteria group bacterium]
MSNEYYVQPQGEFQIPKTTLADGTEVLPFTAVILWYRDVRPEKRFETMANKIFQTQKTKAECVLEDLKARGLNPATGVQLLAVFQNVPERERYFPIAALGTRRYPAEVKVVNRWQEKEPNGWTGLGHPAGKVKDLRLRYWTDIRPSSVRVLAVDS